MDGMENSGIFKTIAMDHWPVMELIDHSGEVCFIT
jgi:hypothetical protein